MQNGLGVLGWGVGGIEAEAAMLGQPVSMLIPRVVGFRLTGELPAGATATDLVLTITELLRQHGVVGKFVEFYGDGVAAVPVANRATIGNMSPEFGSTCAIFPIDEETLTYLRLTGRPAAQVALVEAYAREQGLWHDPARPARYSEQLQLDLATVVPSLAGPKRPQDRVALSDAKAAFRDSLGAYVHTAGLDNGIADTFPASDPVSGFDERPSDPARVTLDDGTETEVDHGSVVIAAITSCTNTSNPSVMVGAALLAKKAVEAGLERKPWVKTTLAPGSKVVMDYYERAGLTPYLEKLGFNLVGYGCTTCIGNSGPLSEGVSAAVAEHDLAVVSVLSGNRNFEGRINPDVKMNYLASPPLVVAYALAGTMDLDLTTEPIGTGAERPARLPARPVAEPGRGRRRGPDRRRGRDVHQGLRRRVRRRRELAGAGRARAATPSPGRPDSTYVRRPAVLRGHARPARAGDRRARRPGAGRAGRLGDHRPHLPGRRDQDRQPGGQYLTEHGVERRDFNSYGSRRGNHEVMIRGTFANIRLRNQLAPGTEGGVTIKLPEGTPTTIYDASREYLAAGTPLIVLGGKEYGSGSSRDWAAKGTALLGVRAVLVESFERIHRSNLIGMGVLPLQYQPGQSAASLGLTGHEVFDVIGIEAMNSGDTPREVTVRADDKEFRAIVRIDTPGEAEYYRHGGIMQYVLRSLQSRG